MRRTSMPSISTTRGDKGETSLAGGIRVSKSSLRVEAYGTTDELNATLGLARALCTDADLSDDLRTIQLELFLLGSALATPPESPKPPVPFTTDRVDRLTGEVHRLEAIPGLLADWSLPGTCPPAAALDVSRTVCRRAERALVRLVESGEVVPDAALAYLNRLSDLLWLYGRKVEHDGGLDGSLRRITGKPGTR